MREELIKICTIRKMSHHKGIKNVKNAFLEDRNNVPAGISHSDMDILEDYSYKNVIKRPEDAERLYELVLPTGSMWGKGREIKIAFMGGSKKIKDHVKEIASEWLQHANLNFVYINKWPIADIRITFYKRSGSWSMLGTDNLSADSNEATMNFGWLDADTGEEDFRSVVLHEFGHMIGCGHEHESPKNGGVPWSKEKAYDYYMKTQGWTREEIDEQIFDTYRYSQVRGTKLDKKSIMMYAIPESITIGNFKVGWNTELSRSDKAFIKKIYPMNE